MSKELFSNLGQLEELYQGNTITSVLHEMSLGDYFIGDDCGMHLPRSAERFFKAAFANERQFLILYQTPSLKLHLRCIFLV